MARAGSKIVWRHIRGGRRLRNSDLNIRPIMNLFMILIPCLMVYATFVELAVIRTAITQEGGQQSDKIKPGLILEMDHQNFVLRSQTFDIAKLLQNGELTRGGSSMKISRGEPQVLQENLKKIQAAFPGEREITLVPLRSHPYQEVVSLMDLAKEYRQGKERLPLFPNIAFIEPKGESKGAP